MSAANAFLFASYVFDPDEVNTLWVIFKLAEFKL